MQLRKVVLILGTTGSGKTYLTRQLRTHSRRTITLDPMGEYDGLVFTDFGACLEHIETRNLFVAGDMNIVCRFESDLDNEYIFKLSRLMSNFLLVVEEAEIYLDPRRMNKDFLWLIRYGRHPNISLLCIARRVPEIVIDFRAMTTSIISFRQVEPNDLDHLEAWGIEQDAVRELPDHEYVIHGVDDTIDKIEFKNENT